MFYLVCFDIVDDRKRYKTVKILKDYGVRVQKSVFECRRLSEKGFLTMKSRIEEVVDEIEDSVRYYYICKECIGKFENSGFDDPPLVLNYTLI